MYEVKELKIIFICLCIYYLNKNIEPCIKIKLLYDPAKGFFSSHVS
jgi:hypothetical protein